MQVNRVELDIQNEIINTTNINFKDGYMYLKVPCPERIRNHFRWKNRYRVFVIGCYRKM